MACDPTWYIYASNSQDLRAGKIEFIIVLPCDGNRDGKRSEGYVVTTQQLMLHSAPLKFQDHTQYQRCMDFIVGP